ncbi:MAG: hypothetical protein WCS70_02435 [Verrucomicrobiota bacterium]
MSITQTFPPKPGQQLWGIYYTDREYAREVGDPICTVVEASTKLAAEEIAVHLGFKNPWAHPITTEPAKQRQELSHKPTRGIGV